tara:strand:+ start:342 stop:1574 length:1233 start_codon:yes stop_codon:yes gene_type:complete
MKASNIKVLYLINQILSSGFPFIVLFYSARNLDLEDFGNFSYAYSFIPLFSIPLISFVLFPLLNYYVKWKNNEKEIEYINTKLYITIFISFFSTIILFLIMMKINVLGHDIFFFITYFFFYQIYELLRKIFIVKNEIIISNFIECLKFLSTCLVLFFLTNNQIWSVKNILNSILFIIILSNFLYVIFAKIKLRKVTFLSKIYDQSYSFGKWIFLSNFTQNLSSNLFIFISALFLSSESIGMLNAPKLILGLSTVVLLAMENYYTPKIAEKVSLKSTSFIIELRLLFLDLKWFYIIFCFFSIFLIFAQHIIMGFLFGNNFIESNNYLWGFVLIGFIFTLTRPFLILLRVFDKTKFIFQSSFILLMFTALITFPLMYNFAATGGLLSAIISSSFYLLMLILYTQKYGEKIYS